MPHIGFGSRGRHLDRVPGAVYFDLATWHLINTVYAINRVIDLKHMVNMYADEHLHRRLITVLEKRLGHELAARAEGAKIDVAMTGTATIDLARVEAGLAAHFDEGRQRTALAGRMESIVNAAHETLRLAGVQAEEVGALYFTGGSTGLGALTHAIGTTAPAARRVTGDRFASVVSGLGVYAERRFIQ